MMLSKTRLTLAGLLLSVFVLNACADATVPEARNVDIPAPVAAQERQEAINERDDSVMYLPLGRDVLVPARLVGDVMPSDFVGPFELRGETLAGALQLILADYDISIAFETQQGLSRKVTVANLRGPLDKVINRVCSLADLYCSYEDEALIIKDTQTFTVTLPPLTGADGNEDYIADIVQGLTAIIGASGTPPISDPTTRSLIYSATQRTSKIAENYFQRLRANTAMIVFETYIWEVLLNGGNSTGIDWTAIDTFGKFTSNVSINGSVGGDFLSPISIGLPTTQSTSPTDMIQFISQFGAVKTISQPKITVLSGAQAELRVADTQNYVSEVSQTINGDNTTTSVDTDSVDSGFTLTIGSSWDKSTIYANVNINLTNVDDIEDFTFSDSGDAGTDTIIQLPQTTERELTTQIRVRPGDSVLIAGLVRERDNFDSQGPGFMKPIIPDSRTAQTENLELVILLKPRVVVYTDAKEDRFKEYQEVTNQPVSQEVYVPHSLKRNVEKTPIAPPKKSMAKAMKAEPIPAPKQKIIVNEAIIEEPVAVIPVAPEPSVVVSPKPLPTPIIEPVKVAPPPVAVIPAPEPQQLLQERSMSVTAPKVEETMEEVIEPVIESVSQPSMEEEAARAEIIINNDVEGAEALFGQPDTEISAPQDIVEPAAPVFVPAAPSNDALGSAYVSSQPSANPYLNSGRNAVSPRISVRPDTTSSQTGPSSSLGTGRVSPAVVTE